MSENDRFFILQRKAQELRLGVAKMFYKSINGHYGGCFSIAEIIACLYFDILNVDPKNPKMEDRDRFVISKGHCTGIVFNALADRGFFPEDWLDHYEELGSPLYTHPNMLKVPGCDMSTGSLGHGLSASLGMALGAKLNKKDYFTYCLLGDGECQEGEIWEAAMSAAKYKLDNLIAIVDRNYLCVTGNTEEVMPLEPFAQRWEAFGWEAVELDGHNCKSIVEAIESIKGRLNGKPKVIIAKTIKGKGVSFMENNVAWHGRPVNEELQKQILEELSNNCYLQD